MVVVTNLGTGACTIEGYPVTAWFVSAAGDRVPGEVVEQAASPPALVELAPGGKASTTVWSTGPGVPPPGQCQPTATSGVTVVPPGQTASLFAVITTTVCGADNVLGTTPFAAGTSESPF